jgi:hypothetical protein
MPSFGGPAAADVETYAQAANADAPTRIKLFRLAFDAAVSSFSGRQQLYERYYSGDPVRLAGALYALYDKDAAGRPHPRPARPDRGAGLATLRDLRPGTPSAGVSKDHCRRSGGGRRRRPAIIPIARANQ